MHPAMRPTFLKHVLFLFAVIVFAASCTGDEKKGIPNISNTPAIRIDSRRFDRAIAGIDTANIANGLVALQKQYPDFLNFWLDDLMQFGIRGNFNADNPALQGDLRTFLTYKDFRGLFDTVAAHFPDTRQIEEPLSTGFRYYRQYYPKAQVPKIVYFVSGLNNWSVITVDSSIVGIGLDMYLGQDYPFYKAVQIPDYMVEQLRPEAAPVNVFKAIHQQRFPFIAENKTLLDMMMQRGKQLYFLSKVLPFVSEETYIGYTKAQLDWCKSNEAYIYNFFVKANLLYEKNWTKILRFVNEGPQTPGMPEQSPGNIGSWLGGQMVKAYMDKHPDLPMDSLFANGDSQALLQEAQYKPR
jgi:hypothetical protein